MKKHDLAELEIDVDGADVKLKKTSAPEQHHYVSAPIVAPAHTAPGAPQAGGAQQPAADGDIPGTVKITSPMVGTFYRASKPDADPYVDIESEINDGTVLCIIEAMKVMNEIKAEQKGKIVKILVENGEPVEYGQPLFLLAPM